MWFAAMESPQDHPWFAPFIVKLLEGNPSIVRLLRFNPFPEHPPRFIRAELFVYRFTTADERRRSGQWWKREPVGFYLRPVSLRN
jgi:hypothetical protein